jgi:alkanesulfonate monooxygenase SsuD/methylene tetrahydromethanopterin reductase-like flavin-dependent oxidoreductase (luciferase family)
MSDIAFGIFDHLERRDEPLDRIFEERLQLAAAADAAGFFCYHVAEHHATPLGLAPSPGIFLSAVAARTQRIHMGPLVYLLPSTIRCGSCRKSACSIRSAAGASS